ncbi:DUF5710 domain-containing protein [Robbsia andropogonis]|uniref:DUF5710 domain-containing protein n=1 Tax=Robbsia andropogonis TaxID=28092 RepID=UPI002A6A81D4|nr:DUF5710 domain-containing protein [Robbsia andropogonis]
MADANKPKGERTYLDVPFKEKQSARELGAKFDRREKKWYVPAGSDPSLFARWMPSGPKERPLSEGQSDDFESDIEREAQRLSGLTDQPIDESRQFVREALRLAEEKAALAARDRVQEQGGSAFESIDAIRSAIIEARRAYFAQRQHLYEQGNAEAEPRALPEADARVVLDDVTLGRRYRDMIQSIATSSTLRGAEVTATLALEERLETIHREAWRKSGSPENGERAIGEHIRAGSDFAAQALPPRAARALNTLRQEAGLSPIGIEADQAVDDRDLRQVPESLAPSDQADAPPMSDIAGPSESETANTPSALQEQNQQEQNHSEGRAAANDATAPLVSPAPASNEPDAKNPANDAAPPVLGTVSEADLNRVRKVREADRVAAQTLLRERGQALPRPEDASPEVGAPHDERGTDIEDNQIDIDAALRKPITTSDGYTVPAHIASRYMIKEGRYWRLDSMQPGAQPTPATKPHFEDVGKRLITQQNDRGTIADMLAVMKAKNIDAITVKGSETFRRNAWLEAALDGGIEVKNFTPKESDLALLEAAKRERDALTIKAGSAPAPVPYRDAAKGDVQRTRAATQSAIDKPVPGVAAKPADTLSGVLLEHGAARFQHQADASYSYFVHYRDATGHEQTVWGVDLKRAMQASEAKPGDTISLKNIGETPVTVQEPVRDAAGRVTGMQDKEVLRNTWEVTREAAPQPATQALPEKVATRVQAATPSAIDEPVPGVAAKPADTLSGVLLAHGAARFQHQPDASYSYFVQYRDATGHEQTVWGVDLKRAMQASEAKPGDTISLKNMGETQVTVQEPVRDAAGRVTGMQDKEAFRNTWEVTRESSPQPATQAPPVTVAQIRERLIEAMEGMPLRARNEVLNRFDARMKAGVEVEGMMNQGGLNWEAAVSELDKRHAALRAGWSAPKAAPVAQASPSLQPVSNKPAM